MSDHSTGTLPETCCAAIFGPLDGSTFTHPDSNPKYYRFDLSSLSRASLQTPVGYSMNIEHTHTIPALTTGGMSANATHSHTCGAMSANETHTHTISTTAAEKTISDFGSGTAFSILPPYTALNVWYRVN